MRCGFFSLLALVIPRPAADAQQLLSFLDEYCIDCHSTDAAEGGIVLDVFRTPDEFLSTGKKLLRVMDVVQTGVMPPSDASQPSMEERSDFTGQIMSRWMNAESIASQVSGGVIRRLNRREYDNTIGDLTGMTLGLAKDFPADDIGFGYDNIGSALNISPVHVERYLQAAEKAIANPLLDEISLKGAKGVLINITGGMDMTLYEVDEAANRIREEVDPDANIIVGSTFDTALDGSMRVSVVATGIDCEAAAEEPPVIQRAAEPVRGFRLKSQQTDADTAANDAAATSPAAAATDAAYMTSLPPLDDSIDPAEYEAEVIIHKPQPDVAAEAEAVPAAASHDAPVAAEPAPRGAVVAREEGAAYIAPEARRMQAKPRKKAPGFFERITGASRARDEDADRGAATPLRPAMRPAAQPTARTEPRMTPRPVANPAAEAPQRAAPAQQATPVRELAPEPVEEEQLEIPAFLRRQAN